MAVFYWMSGSAAQHKADLLATLTIAVLCFVLWPLVSRVDSLKTSRQNKMWLAIALVVSCFAFTFVVMYPKYLQAFA